MVAVLETPQVPEIGPDVTAWALDYARALLQTPGTSQKSAIQEAVGHVETAGRMHEFSRVVIVYGLHEMLRRAQRESRLRVWHREDTPGTTDEPREPPRPLSLADTVFRPALTIEMVELPAPIPLERTVMRQFLWDMKFNVIGYGEVSVRDMKRPQLRVMRSFFSMQEVSNGRRKVAFDKLLERLDNDEVTVADKWCRDEVEEILADVMPGMGV